GSVAPSSEAARSRHAVRSLTEVDRHFGAARTERSSAVATSDGLASTRLPTRSRRSAGLRTSSGVRSSAPPSAALGPAVQSRVALSLNTFASDANVPSFDRSNPAELIRPFAYSAPGSTIFG